jgi:hypothetical protein
MTIASYRLKLTRVNNLKFKVSARIPARFVAESPVLLERSGGLYTVSLDINALIPSLTGLLNDFTDLSGNIAVTQMNSGTDASSATYWRGDGVWATPAGSGDVVAPASSTDNAIVRFDGTSGALLQDSLVTINDLGHIDIDSDSTFIGKDAGAVNNPPAPTDGINNTFIGSGAGAANTSGYAQTFIGYNAGNVNTTGIVNTFIGYQAGLRNTIGGSNTFIGTDAGAGNVHGDNQVIIGFHAGLNLGPADGAGNNVIIGYEASITASTGVDNTMVGNRVGYNNTSGDQNVFIGSAAGFANTTADFNVLVGYNAGTALTTGGSNTFVGGRAGETATTGTGNVFIGRAAGFYETGSSKLFIDNAARTNESDGRVKALVYGIFDAAVANQYFQVNGNILGAASATFGATTLEGSRFGVVHDGASLVGARMVDSNAVAGADNSIVFVRNASTVGSIQTSLTNTVYNTSSDRDRKTDIRPFERSGEIVDALQIRDFEWKLEPGTRGVGVVAQEAFEVFPDAVSPSVEPGGWAVDYSKYVPVLIAEIQQLRARVKELESS